ncbi:MAG: chaperone NapD [Acidobacteriota bacterium]|nr:chaperone NapD [Acidobacteriota bacterium]
MPASAYGQAHVSGLLVTVRPGHLDSVERSLAALPGVAVHVRDDAGGRLVTTLETPSLEGQKDGHAAMAGLPHVMSVAMVCHYVDGPGADPEASSAGSAA